MAGRPAMGFTNFKQCARFWSRLAYTRFDGFANDLRNKKAKSKEHGL